MLIVVIILLALCLFLIWRLRFATKMIAHIANAVEAQRSFLAEKKGTSLLDTQMGRLQNAVNALVHESQQTKLEERGHLRRVETILRNIKEAILIMDDDHNVVMANQSLQKLLGMEESLAGKRVETLMQNAEFLDLVQIFTGGGPSVTKEIEFHTGNKTLWFEASGTALPEEESGSRPLRFFVLHDITRQKQVEAIRTDFVANVSHELRTPVTIIKGFTDTLVQDHKDLPEQEREQFLGKIQKNVERLRRLLEDLLDLSGLETPGRVLNKEKHSLGALIREVSENFQGRLDPASQKMQWDLDSSADIVLMDPVRITQVLENILDNALRHAKGLTRLKISTRTEKSKVICIVEDDGQGVPEKDLPHVFERFYRVDKGRSRESGGTGLGLSIVKHIMRQHEGTVAIQSAEGKGTRVILEFSLAAL